MAYNRTKYLSSKVDNFSMVLNAYSHFRRRVEDHLGNGDFLLQAEQEVRRKFWKQDCKALLLLQSIKDLI